jgi:beta-1,4-mannosyltransferase
LELHSCQDGSVRIIARPAFKDAKNNPYNALLYGAIREQGVDVLEYSSWRLVTERWSICHIHWPESLLETGSGLRVRLSAWQHLRILDWARRRSARLVWTIHNLNPHDLVFPSVELGFWRAVLRRLDAVIALNQCSLAEAHARYAELARLPGFVIPHGHYRGVYPNTVDRETARRRLNVPAGARVMTFFGQIRAYKNIPELIAAARALTASPLVLFVCGRTSKRAPGLDAVIRAAAGNDQRIRLELRHIGDDEVQLYLNAADLVVLPYQDILNSGAAILALSFDRPVLVPELGGMAELRAAVGASWVHTYRGSLDAGVLTEAMAWAVGAGRSATPPMHSFDWPVIAAQTVGAYRAISERS